MNDYNLITFNELIKFIYKEIPWSTKEKLSLDTNIVEDLHLWGDDCEEFLYNFCKKFKVDCSDIEMIKCGEEGFNPFEIITFILKFITNKKDKKRYGYGYTIRELLEIINKKEK